MKVVRVLDNVVDMIYRTIFIMVLLIGLYYIYDTVYIFYNASAGRVKASKPNGEAAAAVQPLTDDYIAWLTIDGTSIDYPIMQGDTNNEYLNQDPYGEYSLSGSIFLDSRNDPDFLDSYSLVYGHHMSGGYMFGALDEFEDKTYFQEHQKGTIELKSGVVYDLDLFACVHADANESAIFNPDGVETLMRSLNPATFYTQPKNNHIVALSTCLEPGSTKRTIVFGTLVQRGD